MLMVTATDREERLRRIAHRLDADYDDYYLGVDRERANNVTIVPNGALLDQAAG